MNGEIRDKAVSTMSIVKKPERPADAFTKAYERVKLEMNRAQQREPRAGKWTLHLTQTDLNVATPEEAEVVAKVCADRVKEEMGVPLNPPQIVGENVELIFFSPYF